MAKRTVTPQQTTTSPVSTTNGEGNEKLDNSSSTLGDIQGYKLNDPADAGNVKIRGMAAGYREATRTS